MNNDRSKSIASFRSLDLDIPFNRFLSRNEVIDMPPCKAKKRKLIPVSKNQRSLQQTWKRKKKQSNTKHFEVS